MLQTFIIAQIRGLVICAGIIAIVATGRASAQQQVTVPSATPAPTPSPAVTVSGFSDVGLVDVFNTNKVRFKNGVQSRVFDGAEGPFVDPLDGRLYAQPGDFNGEPTLQNLNYRTTFNGRFGGAIETSVGTDADFIASIGQLRSEINVTQLYARYTDGAITAQLGKFESLAGFEAIESPRNPNFSHSYLSGFAEPGTVMGLRLTYSPSSKLSASLGVVHGWDDVTFKGKGLTAEGNVTVNASAALTASLTMYNGNDYSGQALASGNAFGNRRLYDTIVQDQVTKRLQLAVNYDNGSQQNAIRVDSGGLPESSVKASTVSWSGVAGYATYLLNPELKLALRAETFRDDGGFRTGYDQRLQSRTATLSYSPSPHFIFRTEYRTDTSDQPIFQQRPNLASTPGRTYQNSLGYEFLVLF